MVDVSSKSPTEREATASAVITLQAPVLDALLGGSLPKGDALATARVAGILAAKRTSEWIPLCHPLPLDWVRVEFTRTGPGTLTISCTAKTTSRTGVEMEALTGATAAALTLYDMAKSADPRMVIGPIQLERKTGGRSGPFQRA
jgi:cyclic pyranopterin phosphate synthase